MYCRTHTTLFLSEHGCIQCREAWEENELEEREKRWLEKLDMIQEKIQKLHNYAAGLEIDKATLQRALDTLTINLSAEQRSRESTEAACRRHETKLRAIGLGYRNALEREEDLRKQLEVVSVERGEWIERCRLAEKTHCVLCGQTQCDCARDC